MPLGDWLTPTVIALLVGSIAGVVTPLVRARIDLRKAPAEQTSILLGGAEQAVASLSSALASAERRIGQMEKDLAVKDERIAELERDNTRTLARLARLQARLDRYEQEGSQ